ncbi:hypothetical protein NQ317_012754 [Molorchus minor]|uniref:Uncharacterized protein n=1 Tax=Molorchus minor TaxID=1323400 RepID=A0ABQ9K3E7_9CUCU|nr:hypothetical protein NQ317_012754 [Molorchus minor]
MQRLQNVFVYREEKHDRSSDDNSSLMARPNVQPSSCQKILNVNVAVILSNPIARPPRFSIRNSANASAQMRKTTTAVGVK